jgi:GT2 family glycosyltransferase
MPGTNVSLIIPIFNLAGDRLRNFQFTLARAVTSPFEEIIVVEQLKTGGESTCCNLPAGVRYITVYSNEDGIEKSKLINTGIVSARGDYIWVNDADVYCPFNQIIDAIRPYHIVIQPFKYFVKIDSQETVDFIAKRKVTTQSSYMDALCAGSFIVRRNEFIKIRGMDERYIGWGYEDMEVSLRLQSAFPVETFSTFRGVHLYHPKELGKNNQAYTSRNLELYVEAKRVANEDVFEQINRISSPFEKQAAWINKGGKLVHIISPAFQTKNPLFLHRQMLAINSINKSDHRGVVKIAAFTGDEFAVSCEHEALSGWTKEKLDRDARDISHPKPLPYIKDMLDIARKSAGPDDFIVLSNSDCGITKSFYKNILATEEDYIEFFRVNVSNANSPSDLWINDPNRTCDEENGIDGFAIRAKLYDRMRALIPDLIIGEPYWDPVISGIFKKTVDVVQNRYDLRHPDHPQEWNLSKLTVGGKHNKNCLDISFNNGLLNVRKCEIISDTIVIRIHDAEKTDYQAASAAYRRLRTQDLNVNHILIDIVDDRGSSRLTDDNLGTTGGTRLFYDRKVRYSVDDIISNAVEAHPKARFVILLDECAYSEDTSIFRKVVQQLSERPDEVIDTKEGILSFDRTGRDVSLKAMTRTTFKSLRSFRQNCAEKSRIDTAVVIATFGNDSLRTSANLYAFRRLQKQTLKVQYIWLELLGPNQESQLTTDVVNTPNFKHIVLREQPQNSRLFQKEAMWNIAVANLPDNIKFLFFLDSDIYCDKNNWFAKIRELLDFDNNFIVQPGTEVVTLKVGNDEPEITKIQMTFVGHENMRPAKQPYNFNPGLAVCLTRNMFEKVGGFNPYGFMYGGDTIFLIETCRESHAYYKNLISQSSMRHILRKDILGRKDFKASWKMINNHITHVWHGDESNRTYWAWEHFLTAIDFDARQMLYIDPQGLLAWKTEHPLFNYVYDKKSEMVDRFACRRLIREYFDKQESISGAKVSFDSNNFSVEVWTANVKRNGTEIPISSDGAERYIRLQADVTDKKITGFLSVLSLAPHFVTVDVTAMKEPSIVIEIRSNKHQSQNILLALQSKEDDSDKSQETPRLPIRKFMNDKDTLDNWMLLKIPISEFKGINPARLYGLVVKGEGIFTIDIRCLRIES